MDELNRHRRGWRYLLLSSLVLALASAVAAAAGPGRRDDKGKPRSGKVSPKVRRDANENSSARLDVLVRFLRQPGPAERALVRRFGGQVRREFRSFRWMAVRLPAQAVAALADNPAVEFVASDPPVARAMDVARQAAGEPPAPAYESYLTGAGVTIAMLDSGVASHPEIPTLLAAVDFVGDVSGSPVACYDPALGAWSTVDPNGHGTHVAGILAGSGSHSKEGRLRGVAPEASLVSVRVLDDLGRGRTSDVLAGLQWVLDYKDGLGIRVVNLSLGHPVYEPAAQDPLVHAVEALWDAGVVVVCSAGNAGRSGDATISSPGNSRKAITVGALNDRNTPDTADDAVTTFSSRGPTRLDLVAKPDLLAPGNRIVSARAPGSYLDVTFPERRVAGDPDRPDVLEHFEMSGTSMAAPLVSGTAALMLQQEPWLNPGTVKARLMRSARKATAGNPFATGAGALDIGAALREGGQLIDAPSPRAFPDATSGQMGFENTAVLWSDASFSLTTLWSSAVLWSDASRWAEPLIWSYAILWPDATSSADALLWGDAASSADAVLWAECTLWADAVLWPDSADGTLSSEAVLWPDAGAVTETLGQLVDDP